ncbi:carbamate kinase [Azospirillum soli]|uniref:carbamate kinase n=1 Tax=Azospirillum soli TaxID=1304799 RepID=UPI001AE5D551|nr:carbamate kinase [Azospirillum soli]MBP2316141.1 carbamate kinase [Azospirillum soli]
MSLREDIPDRLIIAIGGNAMHPEGSRGSAQEQKQIAADTARSLLPVMELGTELVITHGNGPVVGKMLLRHAIARGRVEPMPLDICVAHSQGGIAYLLMQALENALRAKGNPRHVVCLLTQVEVDPRDPAFQNPTKPIGYFYTEEEARALSAEMGWNMREDSGRGWRHVVPSPAPKHIVDISLIQTVANSGSVVIAGGGGGVPVVREGMGQRRGVEAVIDKDRTTALMANVLGIKDMIILTAVSRVAINYGKPDQRNLDRVSLSEIRRLHAEGHFPPGSMGPKIDAAIQFLEGGGRRVMIGRLEEAIPMLRGETGTHIMADSP